MRTLLSSAPSLYRTGREMDRIAIQLAFQEITSHPDVVHVAGTKVDDLTAVIEFDIDLGFGDRWKIDGASPTGVLPVERVRFDFTSKFPSSAPLPSLRHDFSFQHAHFQPQRTSDSRPVPCIVFGDLDEFVASRGLIGMVDQLKLWLGRAASDALSLGSTWEPMRRDLVRDFVNCDADEVRTFVRAKAGYNFMSTVYRRTFNDRKTGNTAAYYGRLCQRVSIESGARQFIGRCPTREGVEFGLALVLHADAAVEGSDRIHDVFRPDDVIDLPSFQVQAERFGVDEQFKRAMIALAEAADPELTGIAPLPTIILVRRPRPMPDSESPIELVSYFLQIHIEVAPEIRTVG
ncbi:MAG: hypothetical protein Q8N19_00005 [Phenylobacterium sp.]|uniref:hypothetical protein n=1 Tax=Phenylobacterium sp. TaxID=1871053 RepID=UPI002733C71F|nr:hypothetical protein [Phenylobacterium sp.]MDP3115474.1 hypothetical protein [Phenylobacterium sp.]